MNDNASGFWYRPFWQQTIPLWVATIAILLAYTFFYWQEVESQLTELKNKTQHIASQSQQYTQALTQLPSLHQLEQQMVAMEQELTLSKQNATQFVAHIQHMVTQTKVVLNRLQPSAAVAANEQRYQVEVQGDYPQIYRFIHAIITPASYQTGLISEVRFSPRNGELTATFTLSFIKDDINEQ
ncbi:hypothetical protein K9U65_00440 [Providencia stuartii]|uniref:hypothetical protein n=1 Tax=Providencia stuartii TaxID=588 RepID=UPI00332487FE